MSASLDLLNGGKLATDTLKQPEAPAEAPSYEIESAEDVKKATSKQLDKMLQDQEATPPDGWSTMKVGEKRDWALKTFDLSPSDEGNEADGPEVSGAGLTANAAADPIAHIPDAPSTAAAPALQPKPELTEAEIAAGKDLPKTPTKAEVKAAKAAVKKAKGTAVAVSDLKHGEVLDPVDNLIADIVFEIENMGEKESLALVAALSNEAEVAWLRLGGVLSHVQTKGWYTMAGAHEYKSFREFIEQEHELEYRKAMYYIQIYNDLANSKVPWSKVNMVGWVKLKELSKIITVENVDHWVEVALKNNKQSLIELVKASLAASAPLTIEEQEAKTVTTMTFKVHENQKIGIKAALAKAKIVGQTEFDTMALEYICMDFMAGNGGQKIISIGGLSAQQVFESLQVLLGENAMEVILQMTAEAYPKWSINCEPAPPNANEL